MQRIRKKKLILIDSRLSLYQDIKKNQKGNFKIQLMTGMIVGKDVKRERENTIVVKL